MDRVKDGKTCVRQLADAFLFGSSALTWGSYGSATPKLEPKRQFTSRAPGPLFCDSQIKVMEAEVDESRRRHEKDKLTIDTMNNALQSLKARATELEQVVAVVLGRVVLRMSRFRNCVSQTARLTRLARKQ